MRFAKDILGVGVKPLIPIIVIGYIYVAGGCQKEPAEDVNWWLEQAVSCTGNIDDEAERDKAFIDIVKVQIKGEDFTGALNTLEKVFNGEKPWLRGEIIKARAMSGDMEGAQAAAAAIENKTFKAIAWEDIAVVQAETGDIEGALKTAAGINSELHQSHALCQIAKVQALAGDISGAKKTAKQIKDFDYIRCLAHSHIVAAQLEADNLTGALDTAAGIVDEDCRSKAYGDIAQVRIDMGDIEGGQATFDLIGKPIDQVRINSALGWAYTQAGDPEAAQRAFKQATAAADQIPGSKSDIEVRRIIIKSMLATGEMNEAQALAEGIKDRINRSWAFCDIAILWAQMGDIGEAETLVDMIDVIHIKAHAYTEIALEQARQGKIKRAQALAAKINDAPSKVQAYCRLAEQQAEKGDAAAARSTILKAQHVSDRISLSLITSRIKIKDIEGAWEYARMMRADNAKAKIKAYKLIATAQAETGDCEPVRQWVADEENDRFMTYLYLGGAEGLLNRDLPDKTIDVSDSTLRNEHQSAGFW